MSRFILLMSSVCWLWCWQPCVAVEPRDIDQWLTKGELQTAEKELTSWLEKKPTDNAARFGLGLTQFLRSIERLGQSLHTYGLRANGPAQLLNIPILRLVVADNPNAKPVRYDDLRQVLNNLVADLARAEKTLAAVKEDGVRLPIKVSDIRWDWNNDGRPDERLMEIAARLFGRNVPAEINVTFDRGDVAWLRGYCHLLMFVGEVALAHDGQELFDGTAHAFFRNSQTPYPYLARRPNGDQNSPWDMDTILDAIAFLHLFRMPVKEPERMKSALVHLQQVAALGRETWKFIRAESDNDHEWLPNANQNSTIGVRVTDNMIDAWLQFLDELDDLLAGKRLIPFWRKDVAQGVNLKRVFTEPRTLDVILWVHGTAAAPYLEDGPMTRPEVWQRLQRVFQGEFIGFAIWFN